MIQDTLPSPAVVLAQVVLGGLRGQQGLGAGLFSRGFSGHQGEGSVVIGQQQQGLGRVHIALDPMSCHPGRAALIGTSKEAGVGLGRYQGRFSKEPQPCQAEPC